jgi:spore maturation protein CgeB
MNNFLESLSNISLLLVGKRETPHLGGSLYRAAQELDVEVHFESTKKAFDSNRLVRAFYWHVLGHRPPRLQQFSVQVVEAVREHSPDIVLTTGIAPLSEEALREIGALGTTRVNFSTDDPWNPNHRADWFFEALSEYDLVFTPRHANEDQFRALGCRTEYLPFGYDPELFHPVSLSDQEYEKLHCEIVFVGGGDDDRLELIAPLIEAGFDLSLYGGYWDDYDRTAPYAEGIAPPETVNKATQAADIALCLVRRANRDGHVMRSFEVPSIGACMLVEETDDHRRFFGPEGKRVRYFDSPSSMVEVAQSLLQRSTERSRLADSVRTYIVEQGSHTYQDRLEKIIETVADLS